MEADIAKGEEQRSTFYPTGDPAMLCNIHTLAWLAFMHRLSSVCHLTVSK
jgi:hypothetical protein